MGIARLHDFLRQHRRVGLDTCVFVYQLEANHRYQRITEPVFVWLQETASKAVTSTITMTELLVQPYRDQDIRRVDDCFALLSKFPNLAWVEPSLAIADVAASLRARHRLKTPDALQAATAISLQVPGLITNDPAFQRVSELEVLVLDELL